MDTLWLHCGYIVATLWLHCGYIVVTLWLHCGHIVVTLWRRCSSVLGRLTRTNNSLHVNQLIQQVDSQVVKLKVTNGEFEDLEDHKRSLQHRLIEERGKQRQQDDLISVSGMSVYSENGLMLNQVIHHLISKPHTHTHSRTDRQTETYTQTVIAL